MSNAAKASSEALKIYSFKVKPLKPTVFKVKPLIPIVLK